MKVSNHGFPFSSHGTPGQPAKRSIVTFRLWFPVLWFPVLWVTVSGIAAGQVFEPQVVGSGNPENANIQKLTSGLPASQTIGGPASATQNRFPPAGRSPVYAQSRILRSDASLRTVAFNGQGVGIASGDRGTILRSMDHGQSWKATESGVECTLHQVQWLGPDRLIIVGGSLDRITGISRGVVLLSHDGGTTWKRLADQELPALRDVQRRGDVLIASGDWSDALLTNRFESNDFGRSWQASLPESSSGPPSPEASELIRWVAATRRPIAIRHACRMSDQSLCAVGDHGVILVSRDRGKTWTPARGEDRQTAILMVCRDPESVAWSLLGSETLEARSRVALLVESLTPSANGADESRTRASLRLEQTRQAAISMGASGVDMISPAGSDHLAAAAQWVAIHRPAVLILDPALRADISDAFFQAATAAGVGRVIRYSLDGSGETAIHQQALLTKTGVPASDIQTDAMHWINPWRTGNPAIQIKYLYDAADSYRRGDSLLSGLNLPAGFRMVAPGPTASRRKLQIAQARLKHGQQIDTLIHRSRSAQQFTESLGRLLDQTSKEDQFRLAWSIVLATNRSRASLRSVGFHEAALDEFARRFSSTSAGRWASLRKESIANSLEWQRLRSLLSDVDEGVADTSSVESVAVSPFQVETNPVRQVSGMSPLVVPRRDVSGENQPRETVGSEVDLLWEFHPLTLLSREAARQRNDQGLLQVRDEEPANLKRLGDSEHPWAELLKEGGAREILARRATKPPRLDGKLEDDCWKPIGQKLAIEPRNRSTDIRVAYDEAYVYLSIQCAADQIRSDNHADASTKGLRDQDLTEVDRLICWIDVDCDVMSAMQLQVSDAGRVHDAIDTHDAWQPTWYPALHRDADTLTLELAILRRDLVELPITAGASWFLMAKPLRAGQSCDSFITPDPDQWSRVVFQP